MTTVRVEAIHPKCLAAMPGPGVLAGCECKEWEGHQSWWLCAHHDSFNDGCWAVADAEPDSPTALIGQLMQIAHGNALFNGGFGDRDPVVGFSLIMAEWNRICAENDNYETEIERLRSELVTANHRVAGLTETWRRNCLGSIWWQDGSWYASDIVTPTASKFDLFEDAVLHLYGARKKNDDLLKGNE